MWREKGRERDFFFEEKTSRRRSSNFVVVGDRTREMLEQQIKMKKKGTKPKTKFVCKVNKREKKGVNDDNQVKPLGVPISSPTAR